MPAKQGAGSKKTVAVASRTRKPKTPPPMEITEPTPVFLRWVDSIEHYLNWEAQTEYAKNATYAAMVHETLGYQVGESDHSILITGTIRAPQEGETTPFVGTSMQIPKAAILDRLEVAKPEPKPRGRRPGATRKTRTVATRKRAPRKTPTAAAPTVRRSRRTRQTEMDGGNGDAPVSRGAVPVPA